MRVWAAMYNNCIHESADAVISLHETEAGAQAAIDAHRAQVIAECPDRPVPYWETWGIEEMDVQP